MMLDVTVGLILIGIVAALFTTAIGAGNKAANRLADARAADRLAEDVMTQLQTGAALSGTDAETTLSIGMTNNPPAPAGSSWAEVNTSVRGRRATLWGVVPASATQRAGLPRSTNVEATR
jgi:hypothetical protein